MWSRKDALVDEEGWGREGASVEGHKAGDQPTAFFASSWSFLLLNFKKWKTVHSLGMPLSMLICLGKSSYITTRVTHTRQMYKY